MMKYRMNVPANFGPGNGPGSGDNEMPGAQPYGKKVFLEDQYGVTYQKSSPAIQVPKMNSAPNYGKKIKSAPVYGGNQYGVTLCKSEPFGAFVNSKPGFNPIQNMDSDSNEDSETGYKP
jgi:hypothetical protein